MAATKYKHSAYWYAYHYSWTYSEAKTLTGQYINMHAYHPHMKRRPGGKFSSENLLKWRNTPKVFDSRTNPLLLAPSPRPMSESSNATRTTASNSTRTEK